MWLPVFEKHIPLSFGLAPETIVICASENLAYNVCMWTIYQKTTYTLETNIAFIKKNKFGNLKYNNLSKKYVPHNLIIQI